METLLSFCIPTFNRRKLLEQTLLTIIKEIESLNDLNVKVDICISDNCSTDGTDEMISNLVMLHSVDVIYAKNEINIGFDRNILKVVSLSNAKYCWLFGSDDLLIPGSLNKIISELNVYTPADLFLCSRIECDEKMSPIRKNPILNNSKIEFDTSIQKDLVSYFDSGNGLIGGFSFISELIFFKNSWDKHQFDPKFDGLVYSHVFMILSMIKHDKIKIKVISDYMINCRLNDDIIKHEGVIKRILLDLNGYRNFAKHFFEKDLLTYNSFVSLLRKEHPISTILYLRRESNHKIWKDNILPILKDLNYNSLYLKLIDYSPITVCIIRVVDFANRKLKSIKR